VASVLDGHLHGPLSLDLDGLSHVDDTEMRALRGLNGQPMTIHAASKRREARCGPSARTTTSERSLANVESGMATTTTREAGRIAGEGAHAAEPGGARRRLTDAEERRLVLAAKEGDEPRRAELVEAFMPLIARVARAYRSSPSVDRRELMQEGVVGLLQALERYDATLGTPFWAYASWWVRQAMQQIVAQLTRPMVLSDRALRQLARVRNAERSHLQEKGREPSLPELAEATGIDVPHIECLACAERRARALQEPLSGDEGGSDTFGDLLRDPTAEDAFDRVPQQLLASELAPLLGELSDRERSILCGRFGIGGPERTLRELAGSLGVSAERVRQIEQHALGKLHEAVSR
jgi:RNA polymerase primary sigma factor